MKEVICGIYKIINQIDGKVYIGQSVSIYKRWKEHRSVAYLEHDEHYNTYLYYAIRKYGLENFSFEIIEKCTPEELNEREMYWIEYYDSFNREKGYNLTKGGDGRLYDYDEIFQLWNQGLKCKEIEERLHCDDGVVTLALRLNGVSKEETMSKRVVSQEIVALSEDRVPLKIFHGRREISKYLTGNEYTLDVSRALKNGWRAEGYYWEFLNENNIPKKELSKEEFLSYQGKVNRQYTEEQKEEMSIQRRKVERPCREDLKGLIRNKSFSEIGRLYNVSDNAIRKWCKRYNLPTRKMDINAISDEDWTKI